jgi:NAD(P)-dependent dehydrogenase (short-subunit alcohol dehydrogenase family)
MRTYYLSGKVAVVLGASAQRGIGWAIAEALGNAGAKVVVGARSLAPLQVLAGRIGGTAVVCDAAKEADVAKLARTAVDTYGKLDIAINCAAAQEPGMFQDFDIGKLRQVVEVNYFGMANFIKYTSLAMGERQRGDEGSIILFSSLCSTHPIIPLFGYGSTKAAVDCMVRYAALELGPKGIKINSILPGPVPSEMNNSVMALPGFQEMFTREIPFGRIGRTADMVDAALWLADGAWETGLNLHVSGGMHLTRFPYPDEMPSGGMESFEHAKSPSEQTSSQ